MYDATVTRLDKFTTKHLTECVRAAVSTQKPYSAEGYRKTTQVQSRVHGKEMDAL